MNVLIKYIPNFMKFDGREQQDVHIEILGSTTVRNVLNQSGFKYAGMRVIANSQKIDDIDNTFVTDGAQIIITNHIRIGVLAKAAAFLIKGFIKHWVSWSIFITTTAYGVYSSLQRARTPTYGVDAEGIDEGSAAASWDGVTTTQDVGIPIPVCFGEVRVGGNIINQYLRSDGDNSYLNVLLGLCQGEIESIGDILINDNPIENFSGIITYLRYGTTSQSAIPNFGDLHNVIGVSAGTLLKNVPYIYTTIDADIEAFELIFTIPSLFQVNTSSGAIESWSVTYQVEIRVNGTSSWTDLGSTTISAKSRTTLRRTYRKTGLSANKYDIRITRTSDDSSLDPQREGDISLHAVDEIKTGNLNYPDVALFGVEALATNQLSGATPNFSILLKGLKVDVPQVMNGAVEVDWEDYYWDTSTSQYRRFSDDAVLSWDGTTYVKRYSANPIWCLRYLFINNVWGLGDQIDSSQISNSEYLYMSRICERKVDDGEGGYEKLYRLDVVIDSLTKAMDVISQLAATFDTFVFYSEGMVKLKIDIDEDPIQLFGMGNIIEGSLSEQWKSKKEAYNMIRMQFTDKDKDYRMETISVIEDDAIINGEPLRTKDIRLHTAKMSYALRAARRELKVARNINHSIEFKVGIESLAITPGDPIGFSHDVPGIGFSGRVKAGSTAYAVKIDQTVTIESGKSYKIAVQFSNDSIEERTVTNSPGNTDVITVSAPFTDAPAAFNVYALGEVDIYYKKYRVVSMSWDKDFIATLQAIEMSSNVYDYSAPVIPQTRYSSLTTEIQDVEDLALTEMVRRAQDGTIFNTIEVWWLKPVDTAYHLSKWQKAKIYLSENDGVSWVMVGESSGESFIINENIQTGKTYMVAVTSVSVNGMESAIDLSPQASITILGKAAPPSNVTNFEVSQRGSDLRFSWDPIPDGDLARYVIKKGGDWATGTIIAEKVDVTEFMFPVGQIGEQVYMIKAYDTSGNESTSAAADTITVTPPPEMNFSNEIDPWALNREYKLNNVERAQMNLYSRYYTRDVFVLSTTERYPDFEGQGWDTLEAAGDLDFDKAVVSTGYIEQVEPYDIGSLFVFNIITDLLYNNVSGGNITVQVNTSEDGIAWSGFADIDSTKNYRARYLKFKYILATSDTSHQIFFYAGTIYVNAAIVKVDYGRDVAIAAGGTTIAFRDDFLTEPRITGLSIVNGIRGIIEVVSKDVSSMTIKIWDPVTASYIGTAEIDWEVKGS